VQFLPPYSPDLSPIENCGRSQDLFAEHRGADQNALDAALSNALATILALTLRVGLLMADMWMHSLKTAISLPRSKQLELVGQLKPLRIHYRRARGLKEPEDIINEILCAEFGYPLQEHRERARVRHFTATCGTMAAGFTLRNSAKFHLPTSTLLPASSSRAARTGEGVCAVPIRLVRP